jgi:hypothetical protein
MEFAGWKITPEDSSMALFFATRAARTVGQLIERLD